MRLYHSLRLPHDTQGLRPHDNPYDTGLQPDYCRLRRHSLRLQSLRLHFPSQRRGVPVLLPFLLPLHRFRRLHNLIRLWRRTQFHASHQEAFYAGPMPKLKDERHWCTLRHSLKSGRSLRRAQALRRSRHGEDGRVVGHSDNGPTGSEQSASRGTRSADA